MGFEVPVTFSYVCVYICTSTECTVTSGHLVWAFKNASFFFAQRQYPLYNGSILMPLMVCFNVFNMCCGMPVYIEKGPERSIKSIARRGYIKKENYS